MLLRVAPCQRRPGAASSGGGVTPSTPAAGPTSPAAPKLSPQALHTLVRIKHMRRLWPNSERKNQLSQSPATPGRLGPGLALEASPADEAAPGRLVQPHATLGRIGSVRRASLPSTRPPATLQRFWSSRDDLLPQQRATLGRRGSTSGGQGPRHSAARGEGIGIGQPAPIRQLFV